MRFALIAAAACLTVLNAAAAAEKGPSEPAVYIFDLLPLQPYKGSLARLIVRKGLPDWVEAISTRGEGAAVPSKTVDIGGAPYRLDHVCKPHDCAGNTLDVLWAPAGHKAWAALVDGGKAPVMLGDPPPPQAKVLADAAAGTTMTTSTPPAPAPPAAATPPAPAPPPAAAPPTAAATPPVSTTSPEAETYIFDLLASQPYKGNLARLVKGKGLPGWVAAISVKGEGTAGPGRTIDIGGTPYRLDRVCKPHDCAGNTLDVLWSPGGRRVWAALVEQGKAPVMLGKPPAAEEKALMDAAIPKPPVATSAPAETAPAK